MDKGRSTMYEVNSPSRESKTLDSLSLFIGTGECNANCAHCAGRAHRKYAPEEDGILNEDLIRQTLEDCHNQGARYLSISSSGEPTLSPISITKVLRMTEEIKHCGISYSPINLYSNGIRIGEDQQFCDDHLQSWKDLGLTTVYITVHDINEKKNAEVYGVKSYPPLEKVISRIHKPGLLTRANLVLSKRTIHSPEKFAQTINHLQKIGVDSISAWPIRGQDDTLDPNLAPTSEELDQMGEWIGKRDPKKGKIVLLRENSRIKYKNREKLTLFPDGTLSNTWCNY
jgi:molybdenum cofactor biosynthesis enzyme MoaA